MKFKLFIILSIVISGSYEGLAGKILLLDQFDGKSDNLANPAKSGKVSPKTSFVKSTWGKGFFSGSGSGDRCVTYPAQGIFNPLEGTFEAWLTTGPDFGKTNRHQHICTLLVDGKNCIGVYYNGQGRQIIYWVKDADTPGKNIHQKDLNSFLVGPKLDWKPGQRHHVAITWQKNYDVLYIDGKAIRLQEFRGQVYGKMNEKSVVVVGRDSEFIVDAVRLWDIARSPRKIDRKPTLADDKEKFAYATHPKPTPGKKYPTVISGNTGIAISQTSGLPQTLTDTKHNVNLIWGGTTLMIGDKTATLTGNGKSTGNSFSGQYKITGNPEISVTSKYHSNSNFIKLDLTFKNNSSKVWKNDIGLSFNALTADSQAFMATNGTPFAVKSGNLQNCCSKAADQIIGSRPMAYIPAASIYQPEKDYGFTVTQPMNVPEYVSIDLGHNLPTNMLTMINRSVTIKPGNSRTLSYYFSTHEGDWRAALGWIYKMFPKTFQPGRNNYSKIDGGMIIGGPADMPFLREIAANDVVYREITIGNGKQINFGEYVPDTPDEVTMKYYKGISGQIDNLHKAGILGLLYIQARECKRIPYAVKKFPESISYDSNGKVIESYSFGAKMTCRPGSNWFKHLLKQAKKELKHMPNADGFFFDNSWDKEYAGIINAVADLAHSRGLYIATNGASSNCAAASDSIMAEGTRRSLAEICYLGLAQPVTYVPINSYGGFGIKREPVLAAPGLPENLQLDIKACLLKGAFYAFNYRGFKYFTPESRKIFKHYLPLQNGLKGKKWYLAAHAIKTPVNIQSNIYENGKKELVVYLVSEGAPFIGKPVAPFTVRIRTLQRKISSAAIRNIEDSAEVKITFKRDGEYIELKVENHRSISMLKIK